MEVAREVCSNGIQQYSLFVLVIRKAYGIYLCLKLFPKEKSFFPKNDWICFSVLHCSIILFYTLGMGT